MIVIPIKTAADFAAAAVPGGAAMLFAELSGNTLVLKYRLPNGTVAAISGGTCELPQLSVNGISPDDGGNITIAVGLNQSQVDDRIDTKTAALTAASHSHENKDTLDNIAAVIEAAAMRNAIIFGGE